MSTIWYDCTAWPIAGQCRKANEICDLWNREYPFDKIKYRVSDDKQAVHFIIHADAEPKMDWMLQAFVAGIRKGREGWEKTYSSQ